MKLFNVKTVAAIGAVAFLIFAASYQSVPVISSAQVEFERWLSAREEQSRLSPEAFQAGSPVVLRIVSPSPNRYLSIQLRSSSRSETERVFRILELLREANVFSTSAWHSDEMKWPGISIVIEDGGRTFKTQLGEQDIQTSVRLKTMLKLLEHYAANPPPSPTALNLAMENLEAAEGIDEH